MRNVILLAILSCFFFQANAQFLSTPGNKKYFKIPSNEIGINLFNITDFTDTEYESDLLFRPMFVNGLTYKHNWDKNSLRIGADIFYSSYVDGWSSFNRPYFLADSGTTVLGVLRVGYERTMSNTFVEPFIGIVAEVHYGARKGETSYFNQDTPDPVYETYNIPIRKYGLGPVIGIQFNFYKYLSITIESKMGVLYSPDKGVVFDYSLIRALTFNYSFPYRGDSY